MDIQVGDRITYRYLEIKDKIFIAIINMLSELIDYERMVKENQIEILKIERPKYEVVEEKKELLTEKEREFLKDMCKYYIIQKLVFCKKTIEFWDYNERIAILSDYPEDLIFENIEKDKEYTLKELGLEEK